MYCSCASDNPKTNTLVRRTNSVTLQVSALCRWCHSQAVIQKGSVTLAVDYTCQRVLQVRDAKRYAASVRVLFHKYQLQVTADAVTTTLPAASVNYS